MRNVWGTLGIFCALAVASANPLAAQTPTAHRWADSAAKLIESAVPPGDEATLKQSLVLLERALTAMPNDPILQHYRGYGLYRLAGMQVGAGRMDDAKATLELAEDALEASARSLKWPETNALLSAVLSLEIAASEGSMLVSIANGMRTGSLMERAMDLDKNNPRVWVLQGNGELYTPPRYGGGADKAEESLRKAIALFATDRAKSPQPTWGLIDAHLLLGQALSAQNKRDEARRAYETVLRLAPNHAWVKYNLLPALIKSSGSPNTP